MTVEEEHTEMLVDVAEDQCSHRDDPGHDHEQCLEYISSQVFAPCTLPWCVEHNLTDGGETIHTSLGVRVPMTGGTPHEQGWVRTNQATPIDPGSFWIVMEQVHGDAPTFRLDTAIRHDQATVEEALMIAQAIRDYATMATAAAAMAAEGEAGCWHGVKVARSPIDWFHPGSQTPCDDPAPYVPAQPLTEYGPRPDNAVTPGYGARQAADREAADPLQETYPGSGILE